MEGVMAKKSGPGTKRVSGGQPTRTTPRSASVGGKEHPAKGNKQIGGRATPFVKC